MKIHGSGVELALQEWPGSGEPTLALAHATSFCKEVWDPVVEELRSLGNGLAVVAWDQRSHGHSGRSELPIDWWDLAKDALAIVDHVDGPVVGIGHSSGAAALLMAEILRPGALDLVVAIEPIVFPPPYASGTNHPLAVAARKRRSHFADPEEAVANFSGKELFADWDVRAMAGYVAGGLRPVDDGWELACLPEHEASFYAGAGSHAAWDRLDEIQVPIVLVLGSDSDSHPPAFVSALAGKFHNVDTAVFQGAGHLLPMVDPAGLAAVIDQALTASSAES